MRKQKICLGRTVRLVVFLSSAVACVLAKLSESGKVVTIQKEELTDDGVCTRIEYLL